MEFDLDHVEYLSTVTMAITEALTDREDRVYWMAANGAASSFVACQDMEALLSIMERWETIVVELHAQSLIGPIKLSQEAKDLILEMVDFSFTPEAIQAQRESSQKLLDQVREIDPD